MRRQAPSRFPSLCLLIALQISGVPQALAQQPAAAAAPDPEDVALAGESPKVRELEKEALEAQKTLRLLTRRARHPYQPGTVGGPATVGEVEAAEARVLELKKHVESALNLKSAPEEEKEEFITLDSKASLIETYVGVTVSLATLRIVMRQPVTPSWTAKVAIVLGDQALSDVPGLGEDKAAKEGPKTQALQLKRSGNEKPRLTLTQSFLNGVEVAQLASKPDSANFLTMIQYLGVRQMMQNLSHIRALKQDPNNYPMNIPEPLVSKLKTLGFAEDILRENTENNAEPRFLLALKEGYGSATSGLKGFLNQALIDEIAKQASGGDATMIAEITKPLSESLASYDAGDLQTMIEREFESFAQPLLAQDVSSQRRAIARLLTSARVNLLIEKLSALREDGVLVMPLKESNAILKAIDARAEAFAAEFSKSSEVGIWRDSAEKKATVDANRIMRQQFIEQLYLISPAVAAKAKKAYAGEVINPATLLKTFAVDLEKQQPREHIKTAIMKAAQAPDYVSFKRAYAKEAAALTIPEVYQEYRIPMPEPPANSGFNFDALQEYHDKHDFSVDLKWPSNVNPRLAKEIDNSVTAAGKKDVADLLFFARKLKFNRADLPDHPDAQTFFNGSDGSEDLLQRYFTLLENELVTRYPILSMDVNCSTNPAAPVSMRLYDALNEMNRHQSMSQELVDRTEGLLDQALIQVEQSALANIQKIAQAKDLRELEALISSSLTLELMMSGFAEFKVQRETFIEDLLVPSFEDQLMKKYVGNYVAYGGGAFLVLALAKKVAAKRAGPVVDGIFIALSPMIRGYITATLALMVADYAYSVHELQLKGEKTEFGNLLGTSSADGPSFVDYATRMNQSQAYASAKFWFVLRTIADIGLMWVPEARGVIRKIGVRAFKKDLQAFVTLGIEPGNWKAVRPAMENLLANEAHIAAGEMQKIRAAHERLAQRMAKGTEAGGMWTLEAVIKHKPRTPADDRLYKLLKPEYYARRLKRLKNIEKGKPYGPQKEVPAAGGDKK